MVTRRRNTELVLIVLAVLLAVFGYADAGLALNGTVPSTLLPAGLGLGALAVAAHLAVRRFAPFADPLILPVAVMLSGIGLVLISRLDWSYEAEFKATAAAPNQVMWLCIAIVAFIAVTAVVKHHRVFNRYPYLLMTFALVLLMAPAFFPGDTYGAKRWIRLPGATIEPDEFVKLAICVFFAGYLMANRDALALVGRKIWGISFPRGRNLGPVLVVWAVCLMVLVFENDLGTSLIFFGVFVIMLYVATERIGWVVVGLIMAVVGGGIVGSTSSHVVGRVVAWLHPMDIFLPPNQRPAGIVSDQPAQALFSFGQGGILGTGLGQGHPWLIGFAGQSDFILTTVGEELGLAGVTAVLMLYVLLVERGLRTAIVLTDPFGKLLASGLATVIGLQVFVVTGGVTGLIPLTGKALPFLAQGGSSMVANWLLVAVLIKLSDAAGRIAYEKENPLPSGSTASEAMTAVVPRVARSGN
ncbi:FtsW/RodA/SpoVE family cell cycle protein [Streptomyces sp. RB6PN25]|uniref:FtsW/RodA/SpoVE family cell cycle protein n=1 Tax=Streptomyces humicola TaxID=2953240 RepID=A0ABT1Q508_9ACTN|nr:FtsW/RodA/SpoVE family cell cycle protein [Streptomyces humicola]MCQ4084969.1 FtsW/RodA/SpoVE family cell cycle protein [Streptomyces humicola]